MGFERQKSEVRRQKLAKEQKASQTKPFSPPYQGGENTEATRIKNLGVREKCKRLMLLKFVHPIVNRKSPIVNRFRLL
jgi:hypothetical protein